MLESVVHDIAFLARHLIYIERKKSFVLRFLCGLLSHSTLHCCYIFALFCLTPSQHWRPVLNGGTLHHNPLPVAMHHRAYYIIIFTHT